MNNKRKTNVLPLLSKATMTKLLSEELRSRVLSKACLLLGCEAEVAKLKQYALHAATQHLADSVKQTKDNQHNAKAFIPIDVLCAVYDNGSVQKRLFEFNTINNLLKTKDVFVAADAIMCILLLWANEDRCIKSFDLELIKQDVEKTNNGEMKGQEDVIHTQT